MTLFEILHLAGLLLLALAIERTRRAVLRLSQTVASAAVAQFKAQLAEQGGSMQFTRLSERARGDHSGEAEAQEETKPSAA